MKSRLHSNDQATRSLFWEIVTLLHILDHWESIKQVFLSLIPRNTVNVTFVDFTEESTSKSVESTFETLIIEIDVKPGSHITVMVPAVPAVVPAALPGT